MSGATIHICVPSSVDYRMILKCHDCGHRGRHVATMFVWYPTILACCNCGRKTSGGEWMPREFSPTGRRKAIDAARLRWADAPPRPQADEDFAAMVATVLPDGEVPG